MPAARIRAIFVRRRRGRNYWCKVQGLTWGCGLDMKGYYMLSCWCWRCIYKRGKGAEGCNRFLNKECHNFLDDGGGFVYRILDVVRRTIPYEGVLSATWWH